MIPGCNPLFVDMMAWRICPIDGKACSKENCCGCTPLRAADLDMVDVVEWAEEYMAAKEPVPAHQVSEAAEEAGRRMGYESFRYTEAS